jgi:aspartate-semialdehyde dehydrogenase
VFSISPHARFEFRNPLSVPEANPEVLRLAVANSFENPEWDSTSLVKSPNCVTCGVAIALRALDAKFGGVCDVSITTFQSLSGRGDAKYPKELVMGNVYPLKGTVERTGEYQKAELRRIMPSIGKISIAAYRVPVQKGHLVDIRVSFKKRERGVEKPTSQQIHDAFVEFDPLRDAPLPSKPTRLIRVKPLDVAVDDDRSAHAIDRPPRLGTPRPKDDCEFENGMSIVVGNIDTTDDLFDVTFCVVVNNVARGAWGAALLNAEYWSFLRGRRFPKESEPAE